MFWNQVKKGKKKSRERESLRKKERGRLWNQVESEKKRKRRGWRYMGIRVWWRKIKRKKKGEKKETYG